MRLSRRDRAVMQLAYEHVREWCTVIPGHTEDREILDRLTHTTNQNLKAHDGAPNALHAAIGAMSSFSEEHYKGLRHEVLLAHDAAYKGSIVTSESVAHSLRVLRIRLALYLRTMLRVDRRDFGRWRCIVCGASTVRDMIGDNEEGIWCSKERTWRPLKKFPPSRGFIPLWEQKKEISSIASVPLLAHSVSI